MSYLIRQKKLYCLRIIERQLDGAVSRRKKIAWNRVVMAAVLGLNNASRATIVFSGENEIGRAWLFCNVRKTFKKHAFTGHGRTQEKRRNDAREADIIESYGRLLKSFGKKNMDTRVTLSKLKNIKREIAAIAILGSDYVEKEKVFLNLAQAQINMLCDYGAKLVEIDVKLFKNYAKSCLGKTVDPG